MFMAQALPAKSAHDRCEPVGNLLFFYRFVAVRRDGGDQGVDPSHCSRGRQWRNPSVGRGEEGFDEQIDRFLSAEVCRDGRA